MATEQPQAPPPAAIGRDRCLPIPISNERSRGQRKTPVSFVVVPVSDLGYPVGSPGSSIWAYTPGSSGDWIPSSNLEDIPGTAANRMPNFPHQDTVKRGWLPNEQTPVSRFGEQHEPMSGMHHNMAMGDGGGVTAHGMAGTVWNPVATMQLHGTNLKVLGASQSQSVM
ncbi:uncharacterized protein LOC119733146 [Patiria miniata]|uniref:Uncharacterized protein n=1 Tax=Patiria miniata TaxID=46514 RepID=A0A914AGJ8_PATMI|nr:uncharacterized protein LOC119733146 [Patiria miniata]XP_038062647.1 uncharacterized protein LOC119733146 [Patiria miniata]XP_038062649.1 uncharacterized protein LOC119733146 [Patiria miniata]